MFPRDQFLFLETEETRHRPDLILQRLMTFLDTGNKKTFFFIIHSSVNTYFRCHAEQEQKAIRYLFLRLYISIYGKRVAIRVIMTIQLHIPCRRCFYCSVTTQPLFIHFYRLLGVFITISDQLFSAGKPVSTGTMEVQV